MKTKRETMKKLIAAVVCVAMFGTAIYVMPQTDASATDSTATFQKQSYGAWKDTVPVNGSFEVGQEGMDVYGWSLISTTSARTVKNTNPDAYRDNFHLLTAVESNGNKVAELAKDGTGYMAMVSQEIPVTALKDYKLSIDYNVKDINIDIDPATGAEYTSGKAVYRLSFYVEEIDAEGNSTITEQLQDGSNKESYGWETFNLQFTTKESTEKLLIYCWLGGELRVNETVWLDNIELSETIAYEVPNSSFEKTTYQADGGRTEGVAGPANWTLTRATSGALIDTTGTNAWEDYYQATTTQIDNRDSVVAIEITEEAISEKKAGYVLLQSDFIPVEAAQICDLAAECKLVCYDADGNVDIDGYLNQGINMNLACYDADGNLLSNKAGTKITNTKNSAGDGVEWNQLFLNSVETATDTKYVKIGLYVGYALVGDASVNPAGHFTLYFDNVCIEVDDYSLGYTQEKAVSVTNLATTYERREYYGIRKINAGEGYEDAIQLYVTNGTRAYYGVLFYSEPKVIESGKEYQVNLDLKIEDIVNTSASNGADILLRYKDAAQNVLSTKVLYNNSENTQNIGWTSKSFLSDTTPENAAYVEIGFYIGISNVEHSANPDMKYTYANIEIAEVDDTETWEEYKIRKGTDLLFKILETENAVTVQDLIRIKKSSDTAIDMNLSGKINDDDATLMRWKLLGITTEIQLQYVK